MDSFIPVNTPLLDGNEKKYLLECIDTGWISSEGPFLKQFEDKMSAHVQRKYGVAVCNGSAALDIAMLSLGLEKGSEVIMPAFTIISCASAIVRAGCVPVLVDADPLTWNMDVNQIESKVTEKTKAIMVVHIYGVPVDMDPVIEIAKKYGLKIIEDAAEAHGLMYKDRPCGSFGIVSIFSFYPNKHVTTGEGGMVVTDDENIYKKCQGYRNLCFKPEKRFVHEELGWNFRMTNMQAALGLAQLEKLERHAEIKRNMGNKYIELLKNVDGIQLPVEKTAYADNIYWVFGIVLKDEVPMDAETAMKRLGEKGIGTRPFFWPMHEQPVFIKAGMFENEKYPVAERIARRGFYIPSGLGLSEVEMERVAAEVKNVCI
ncbi:MAG TPA: DegT/DnrJ/EryC1/StrS family aminotransferase [bacterium]|nr:DegT/DnrJ/EryC1/StrS family aminotransferase [bacterium]